MKTTMYRKLIALLKAMAEIFPYDLISIHNKFVELEQKEGHDMRVYRMEEFNAIMGKLSPLDIASRVADSSNFNAKSEYFNFDVDGCLLSFDWLTSDRCNINFKELAAYICETLNPLSSDIVQHVIEEYHGKKGVC